MSTSTTTPAKSFGAVLDALRDVHDEASLWHLSDELVIVAPSGVAAVQAVVDAAKKASIPTKSTNTLRLYRDVAIRFPASERVKDVSFSAHREAIAIGNTADAKRVLLELVKQHGAANVTVTTVKNAIGAATGKVAATPKTAKATAAARGYDDIAVDLATKNGKAFIAALDEMVATNGVTLDGLHAGLSTVLAEVESMRAKAARKAQAVKAQAKPSAGPIKPSARKAANAAKSGGRPGLPAASKATAKAPAVGGKGDLRGL